MNTSEYLEAQLHFETANAYLGKIQKLDCAEALTRLQHSDDETFKNYTLDRLGCAISAFHQTVAGCIYFFHCKKLPSLLQALLVDIANTVGLYDQKRAKNRIVIYTPKQLRIISETMERILEFYNNNNNNNNNNTNESTSFQILQLSWQTVMLYMGDYIKHQQQHQLKTI